MQPSAVPDFLLSYRQCNQSSPQNSTKLGVGKIRCIYEKRGRRNKENCLRITNQIIFVGRVQSCTSCAVLVLKAFLDLSSARNCTLLTVCFVCTAGDPGWPSSIGNMNIWVYLTGVSTEVCDRALTTQQVDIIAFPGFSKALQSHRCHCLPVMTTALPLCSWQLYFRSVSSQCFCCHYLSGHIYGSISENKS